MFYKKFNLNLSKYVYRRYLRFVCGPAYNYEAQIARKNEMKKKYRYFIPSSQNYYWSLEKREKYNQNKEEQTFEETYFIKMLKFVPFIIVSLFGMHSSFCLNDTSQEKTNEEKSDAVKTFNCDPKFKLNNKSIKENIYKENIKNDKSKNSERNIKNDSSKNTNDSYTDKHYRYYYHQYYPEYNYAYDEGNDKSLDLNDDTTPELENNSSISELKKGISSDLKKDSSSSAKLKDNTSTKSSTSQGKTSNNKKDLKPLPNPRNYTTQDSLTLKGAIDIARIQVNRKVGESGAPGIAIAVTVNGKLVWAEGIGFADYENGVRMSPYTVMRIASISKALTTTAIGQLIDEGKLDLDAPIQKYLPSFPEKTFNGEKVTITTRHLLTHTSGIRHYQLKEEIDKGKKKEEMDKTNVVDSKKNRKSRSLKIENESENEKDEDNIKYEEKRKKMRELLADKALRTKPKANNNREFDLEEYYLKEEFLNLEEALQLFQDDDLLFKPGTNYLYSSHGFTLVSAVLEKVTEKSFTSLISDLFRQLAMQYTCLDINENITYRRGRNYVRDNNGALKNAPYVNNSYKWAGGGFLSNVYDLINFGNAILYSYQNVHDREPKGFLKSSTVRQMWTPSTESEKYGKGSLYGLGWSVGKGAKENKAFADNKRFYASHSGGAVGASSVLLIMPSYDPYDENHAAEEDQTDLAEGIVVAVVTNMQNVPLTALARKVAKIFDRVPNNSNVVGNIHGILKNKVYSLEKS